jgi:hypothetical protein
MALSSDQLSMPTRVHASVYLIHFGSRLDLIEGSMPCSVRLSASQQLSINNRPIYDTRLDPLVVVSKNMVDSS